MQNCSEEEVYDSGLSFASRGDRTEYIEMEDRKEAALTTMDAKAAAQIQLA